MSYTYRLEAAITGVAAIGKAPSGTVNISVESGAGTLGWLKEGGGFVPYVEGALTADSSLVAACGHGTLIAVDVTTAPCVIITREV